MKRKILSLTFFLLICLCIHAQKEGYNWTFGGGSGLTWNSTARFSATNIDQLYGTTTSIANVYLPTSFQNKINTYEGCFALSDPATGKLMFYSDGITLYNADGTVMENGDWLGGDPSAAQSGVLLPYPGAKNAGKFIAVSIKDGTDYYINAQYAIIDTNGGTNKVTSKNNVLADGYGYKGESIGVIRHANKKDFWIIVPGSGSTSGSSEKFRPHLNAWLVTENGVAAEPLRTAIPFSLTSEGGYGGGNRYFKFSPNGKHFVWALIGSLYTNVSIVFGNFDSSTGYFDTSSIKSKLMKEGIYIRGGYGVEFSKSGKALYITSVGSLFAFDFESLMKSPSGYSGKFYNVRGSDGLSNLLYLGSIQLAPDGYIYGTYYDSNKQPTAGTGKITNPIPGTRKHMIVITNPESPSSLKIYKLNNFLTGSGGHLGITSFCPSWFAMQIEGPKALCSDPVNGATAEYKVRLSGSERPPYLWWYKDATRDPNVYEYQYVNANEMKKTYTFSPTSTVITQTIKVEGRKTTVPSTQYPDPEFSDTYEVTIYPAPTATADDIDVCLGSPALLAPDFVSDGAEVKWYTTETGGTPLTSTGKNTATSEILNTVGSRHFYMEVSNPACSGPGRIAVQVNVAQTTTPEIIISKPICEGSRMTLEVTGISPNATVKWYDSETGTTLLHEGTKFITPELYVSTSYYAEVTNSACSNIAGRLEGRVVVNTTPSTVITQPSAICAGNTISISATPSTGAIIRWYKNRDDAVPDASGNSYNPTDPLYGNKKFYVEAFDPVTGCYSARDSVEVTVYAIPQLTIDAPGVCPDDKAVITVQTDPDVTVSWYENIGDADPIAKGTTFTSSAGITEEKTYYVEAVNNVTGCRSDRLSVTVSILNCTMPVNPHVRSSYISK